MGKCASEPYISWVKEGRKYDLGALLITQQPGSIPVDILSQGDNWFIFHLLSSVDLTNLQRANAHFSQDILSTLLNEPIPGQGVFWSSVGAAPYPVSLRVLSFERLYSALDPTYTEDAADTFAQVLKAKFQSVLDERLEHDDKPPLITDDEAFPEEGVESEPIDALSVYKSRAIAALRNDHELMEQIHGWGKPWGVITGFFERELPDTLEDRRNVAYYLVREAFRANFRY